MKLYVMPGVCSLASHSALVWAGAPPGAGAATARAVTPVILCLRFCGGPRPSRPADVAPDGTPLICASS